MTPHQAVSAALPPVCAGIGLRLPYLAEIADAPEAVADFLEIHAENFFAAGGMARRLLDRILSCHPISVHGVGLSLGSADGPDPRHLSRLGDLVSAVNPVLVSEHLAWSRAGNLHLNDLLPLPYTAEVLDLVCTNIDRTQQHLGRRLLIENPSTYVAFAKNRFSEPEFLAELVRRTGCGLLLDINNIHVSWQNHSGRESFSDWAALPAEAVGEYHLAGHQVKILPERSLLIDTHDQPVAAEVWELFRQFIKTFGPRPTLIEWDADLPSLAILQAEAATARRLLGPT
jgi:uncharacterized protein (UPF0276 family)